MTKIKKKTETKKKEHATTSALQIYVGEEKISIAQTVKAQVCLLAMQTPKKYIMQRQGRGGLVLEYVETNYVIGRLNATFFFNWDSEIVEQIVDREHNQIAMKVRLTVRFANGNEVKKDAWGGSAIKYLKDKKTMVDLADDLKSAESDGIKKAASMLGICWDVYAGLTSTGKKEKVKKDDSDNGFTDMSEAPDVKSEFRTIPIMISKKKVMHTKYEALDRFKKAKEQLGSELYYKILGEHGFEKANQLSNTDIPKLYDAMATAYKEAKIKAPKETEEVKPEAVEEPKEKPKVEEKPEAVEEPDKAKDQSLGFSTAEVEKEEASPATLPSEFPPSTKIVEEAKPEMPLQREIMSLAGYETILVDKHSFTPDQICGKLKELFGEDELIKLTREQTKEGIEYFKSVIEELDKAKES